MHSHLFTPAKLLKLQRRAFDFFNENLNPENGLVADSTRKNWPCSIAVVGFALSCYPIAVERGFLKRSEALKRTLSALRFFADSEQSTHPEASGHRGFYYHFLDMKSGKRVWKCELSTIDSAILFYGFLLCAQYFDRDTKSEIEVRERTEFLLARADWRWACARSTRVALAWKPEHLKRTKGFLKARWSGYNEAILLQFLALAASEYSLPESSYHTWCGTYDWKKVYGIEYLYAGPLFIHQFPHLWIDFRDIRDEYMQSKNCDYFQNSVRATFIQQEYARRNPRGFVGYTENCWGITAGDGPGDAIRKFNGRRQRYFPYRARGAPYGPDDGTLAPWAMIASLPFAPEMVLQSLHSIDKTYPEMTNHFGFHCSFNPSFQTKTGYWIAPEYFGIDQGPIVLAIENYLTGLPWQLMRKNPVLQTGLRRAGFTGGWLSVEPRA